MNRKFIIRLEEFLSTECDDFGLSYDYEWNEDMQRCEVEAIRLKRSKVVNFRYNEREDCLSIELCEDSFCKTREYDNTVKYFWMVICPALFPED